MKSIDFFSRVWHNVIAGRQRFYNCKIQAAHWEVMNQMPVYTNFPLRIIEETPVSFIGKRVYRGIILGGEDAADDGVNCNPRQEVIIGVSKKVPVEGFEKVNLGFHKNLTIRRPKKRLECQYLDIAEGRSDRDETLYLFLTASKNAQGEFGYIEVPCSQNTPIIADAVSSRMGDAYGIRTWHTTAFRVDPRHFSSVFSAVWYSEDYSKRIATVFYVVDAKGQVHAYPPDKIGEINQEIGVEVPPHDAPDQWKRADLYTP